MEQHIIPLNQGIHLTPSAAEDGQLADCINLVPKDGSLRNAPQLAPVTQIDPTTQEPSQIELATGHTLAFIHTSNTYKHYITKADVEVEEEGVTVTKTALFYHSDTVHLILTLDPDVTIHQITSIGNTIIVLASDDMHYILWKNETDGYKYLGTHIPELPISFGLQAGAMSSSIFPAIYFTNGLIANHTYWDSASAGATAIFVHVEDQKTLEDGAFAIINKCIEYCHKQGKFVYPFLVRYAYRLYDGSRVMHSAPILMETCTTCNPRIGVLAHFKNDNCIEYIQPHVFDVGMQLDWMIAGGEHDPENNSINPYISALEDWRDIVDSVDIYISSPFYIHKQSGKIQGFKKVWNSDSYSGQTTGLPFGENMFYRRMNPPAWSTASYKNWRWAWEEVYLEECGNRQSDSEGHYTYTVYPWEINIPTYSAEEIKASISDNGNFYLLKKIKLEELPPATANRTILAIPEDYITTIQTREQLIDDYDSHDVIAPKLSFQYNSRLNLSNITKNLFGGFVPYSFAQHGTLNESTDSPVSKCFVLIEQDGKNIIVESEEMGGYSGSEKEGTAFFYYPNPNAKTAYIRIKTSAGVGSYHYAWYKMDLVPHIALNGAYYFDAFNAPSYISEAGTSNPNYISPTNNNEIALPNKIYTSEVNNPFYFPASGINTIGTGNIIGLCSAVKALSQGQFGQFPLYAFSTDGVWALEVNSDGTYSVKQPVTRDVCNNPNSITQTDTAVLYATERGLHMLQGSETRLLSLALEAYTEAFDATGITIPSDFSDITSDVLAIPTPLLQQLDTAHISYDGINHIVHVYPDLTNAESVPSTHFILNLDSMEWTRTTQPIPVAFIDGYPNATLQVNETTTVDNVTTSVGKLYQYALPTFDNSPLHQGFILTRETALGAPLTYKILHDLRTLKHYHSAATSEHKVRIVPLVSNDRLKWYRLGSLKAASAIWYRFAVFTNMADSDILEALALITAPRRTNKIR